MSKRVSMREIARLMDVSVVSVSKALGGKPGVSDEMRKQIEEKARELGYQNVQELTHARDKTDVGILVPSHFFSRSNSFYASLCKYLLQQLSKSHYYGILEILSAEDEANCQLPNILQNQRVEGLIILGQVHHAYLEMLNGAKKTVPTVCMDFYDEQSGIDAVISDGIYGSYCLTNHLIHMGHKHIGFIGDINATSSIMERFLGYCKSMYLHHLPIDDQWIVSDRDENGDYQEYPLPSPLPTAFVCNCDQTAVLFASRLNKLGLSIPEDISLVSFDNYLGSYTMSPALTTYAIDREGLASETARLIIEKMSGKIGLIGRIVKGGRVMYRDSVRKISGE